MSKTFMAISVSFWVVLLIVVIVPIGVYERTVAPSRELQDQLKTIIYSHDPNKIKGISIDDETENLLLHVSAHDAITATDSQGAQKIRPGVVRSLFVATVHNQPLQCVMEEHTNVLSVIPDWKLVKVSIKPVSTDIDGQLVLPRE